MPGPSSAAGVAAGTPQPDLWARGMNITADYGTQLVYASGVCENIGRGPASGPFIIQVGITIENDEGTLAYAKNFQVPADLTLTGPPIFTQVVVQPHTESDLARLPIPVSGALQNMYLTGPLEVPLQFVDVPPHATYTAGFTVDVYGQVPDSNWANNQYPGLGPGLGTFWFTSPEARERDGTFIIERAHRRSI